MARSSLRGERDGTRGTGGTCPRSCDREVGQFLLLIYMGWDVSLRSHRSQLSEASIVFSRAPGEGGHPIDLSQGHWGPPVLSFRMMYGFRPARGLEYNHP